MSPAVVERPKTRKHKQASLAVRSFAGISHRFQADIVDRIVSDPYISEAVRHDHRRPGFIKHPDVVYFGAYVDGELVGVYCVIASGFVEVDLHAFLGRAAHPYCRDLARLMFEHIFADPEINRITAQILEGLDSVRNHCRRLGFVDEGFRSGAQMKDGKLIGVHTMGLLRAKWESMQ